jgi:hypothetical protein
MDPGKQLQHLALGVELACAVAAVESGSLLGVEPGGWDEPWSSVDDFDGPAVFVDAVVVVDAQQGEVAQ